MTRRILPDLLSRFKDTSSSYNNVTPLGTVYSITSLRSWRGNWMSQVIEIGVQWQRQFPEKKG
ncbi:Hypothetical protein FKW44_008062 [Caligus rogercresseyi]|uniref:Uncharacterized protein n=1 Tax=Caligus rogercresseyi TaxID=217165 RepID=A0A7T8H073_CALRO|nr:Hypothetical protein FKW44_014878 [Caligus rogercresseyi]QQP55028.1 Hypothetical protein FKW44_008062 [Caligus rogercresseyi]